jgi:hypothetical protein
MSWSVTSRDDSNRFNLRHYPSNLEAQVIRDPALDLWYEVEEGYSIGLGFIIEIGNTTLTMVPDGSGGWYVRSGNEGKETEKLDADDIVEMFQLIVTLIHPEDKNGRTKYQGRW